MQLQAKKVGDSLHYSSRGAPWPHERAGEREGTRERGGKLPWFHRENEEILYWGGRSALLLAKSTYISLLTVRIMTRE